MSRAHAKLGGLTRRSARLIIKQTFGYPCRRGAIAQLGERLDRTQEVAGSSPASSIVERRWKPGLILVFSVRTAEPALH
jgi:hypothetical protein